MLLFTHKAGNVLHYQVSERLDAADLRAYYTEIDANYRQYGKLDLFVTVKNFRGYAGLNALCLFVRHEPGLLRKVRSYTLNGGSPWLRNTVSLLGRLVFWVRFDIRPLDR